MGLDFGYGNLFFGYVLVTVFQFWLRFGYAGVFGYGLVLNLDTDSCFLVTV